MRTEILIFQISIAYNIRFHIKTKIYTKQFYLEITCGGPEGLLVCVCVFVGF